MNVKNFWLKRSKLVNWHKTPTYSFRRRKNNYYDWYPDGKFNIYYNCIGKNLDLGYGNKIAIHYINKNKKFNSYSYGELNEKINSFCKILKSKLKNKKLSTCKIMIHSSASIESSVSMLSCAKLGIHFSVIFEDLAAEAIDKRISLLKPNIFISKFTKEKFFNSIYKKISNKKNIKFMFFDETKIFKLKKKSFSTKCQYFNGDKDFFTLFTSGSTGMPKGIVHSSAGYLVYTKFTCHHQFGMDKNSIILTASDAGWMNGHTYALFGPLSLGATTILVESPMLLIDQKLLRKILKLKVTILYLPVTLIRLMKAVFKKINFQTKFLKTLGSMGEHIAPSVAEWFAESFTNKNNSIVNAYYQTENGAIICSPTHKQKISEAPHGSAGKPVCKYLKINKLLKTKKKEMKILTPWPGCMKRILNGEKIWKKYWDQSGNFRMFDLATIRKGNIFVHGRVDDVINIRGHRIGCEEIESVVLKIKEIFECCAISIPDEIEGHIIFLFIVSRQNDVDNVISDKLVSNFGSFALPKKIYYISELPKTRSGKILRRLLRSILTNPTAKNYGDISTILNKKIIYEIKEKLLKNDK